MSGEEREVPTLLGPLERANLKHWTTNVILTTSIWVQTPDIRLSRREITGKYIVSLAVSHE
jgi:hypothetical protein